MFGKGGGDRQGPWTAAFLVVQARAVYVAMASGANAHARSEVILAFGVTSDENERGLEAQMTIRFHGKFELNKLRESWER